MPQMGESVMEGSVIEWAKKVGDKVEVDEVLLEVATDKVDTEIPSPESGILVEILASEGDTVEVGKPIAVIETDPAAASAAGAAGAGAVEEEASVAATGEEARTEPEPAPAESRSEPAAAAPSGTAQQSGQRVEVLMPQMGESVMEGTVIEWAKKVGDHVETDETLLEIATDKVDTEIPSPESGILLEILAEAGETIEVGQVIAIIGTGSGAAAAVAPAEETRKPQSEEPVATPVNNGKSQQEASPESGEEPKRLGDDGRYYSPLVRSIAKEEGISQKELETIEGSGKEGRVSKEDILDYVRRKKAGEFDAPAAPSAAPAEIRETRQPAAGAAGRSHISAGELDVQRPSGNVEIIKMDRMRKMIAEHMVRSKQTSAHVTTFMEVDVTDIVRWREANKRSFQEMTGVKLTYTPIFIEAIIQAIQEFPLMNSSVEGEDIIVKRDINFGIAVALGEGGKGGLIVPVIKRAQEKNLVGIAKAVSEMADKARNKDLKPDDLVGGTITLTNYGSVGNLMGTPIINQPQVAIIGTGIISKRPVVLETSQGDVIAIRHIMYLSMSYDHRIIDGAHGGAFLSRVKELLESFDLNRSI